MAFSLGSCSIGFWWAYFLWYPAWQRALRERDQFIDDVLEGLTEWQVRGHPIDGLTYIESATKIALRKRVDSGTEERPTASDPYAP
jgi:hypothetical protein